MGGVVEERIAEAALVDEDGTEAGALRLDGAGHAGGAGADDEDVEYFCGGFCCGHVDRLDDGGGGVGVGDFPAVMHEDLGGSPTWSPDGKQIFLEPLSARTAAMRSICCRSIPGATSASCITLVLRSGSGVDSSGGAMECDWGEERRYSGAKARILLRVTARLKSCPDTGRDFRGLWSLIRPEIALLQRVNLCADTKMA